MNESNSSTLIQQIDADLKRAMLDRNEVVKLTLRSVKTSLTEARTNRPDHLLSEADVLAVLQKEAKRRRDAVAEYERVGAPGHAAAEAAELAVLANYLPQQMSEAVAQRAIAQLGATSPKQMGAVMSAIMAEVGSNADGKAVSQVVRRLLSSETK